MEPNIKFGDILTYSDEWYKVCGSSKPEKPVLFVATGKVKEQAPYDYVLYVVRENKSYVQSYHCSFLEKLQELRRRINGH